MEKGKNVPNIKSVYRSIFFATRLYCCWYAVSTTDMSLSLLLKILEVFKAQLHGEHNKREQLICSMGLRIKPYSTARQDQARDKTRKTLSCEKNKLAKFSLSLKLNHVNAWGLLHGPPDYWAMTESYLSPMIIVVHNAIQRWFVCASLYTNPKSWLFKRDELSSFFSRDLLCFKTFSCVGRGLIF